MDILSIGNSFSEDAQRYLHRIAKADGVVLNTFNLFIGGCSLFRHYQNMLFEKSAYTLQMNGESTGFPVSIKDALLNREWDVVTIQQVSSKAPYYDTYQPYLDKLLEYIRLYAPKAEIAFHETWAYEQGSKRLTEELGYCDYTDMFKDIEKSCKQAVKEADIDFFIPSGKLFCELLSSGIEKVHRDTFHGSYGLGRYALGLLWYSILTGEDVENNTFSDFDEAIIEEEIEIAKRCVMDVVEDIRIN